MKKQYIMIFSCFISVCNVYGTEKQFSSERTIGYPEPIIIEIHNAPIVNARNVNNSYQNSIMESNPIIDINSGMSKAFFDAMQDQKKACNGLIVDCVRWIQNNKIKSVCISGLSIYSYIMYQIYRAKQIINDQTSWIHWKSSMSVDDLFMISQKELEHELIHAIQSRYVHSINPTDSIYSLVEFSKDLQQEFEILQQQIIVYQWIESLGASNLFFIQAVDCALLQEKYKKLNFIKHIFISWCADYKIEQNFRSDEH